MDPRLFLKRPDEWTTSDVEELVAQRLPEGQRIEYKAALQLETKTQKAEAAKDISGMANAQGGWLVFGVAEDESDEPCPVELTPFPIGDLLTRLENILDSALEPIPGFEATSLDMGEGRGIILLRVEKSTGRPVMVQGYGQHRYFLRSGTRTRPMSASEVAHAHALANLQSERVHQRLYDLPLACNPSGPARMVALDSLTATPVVSTLVAALDGPSELIRRSEIKTDAFPEDREGARRTSPLRQGGPWTINTFGLLEEMRNPPPPEPSREPWEIVNRWESIDEDDDRLKIHRLAIYRSGVVEWLRRYREQIPSRSLVDDVHDALLFAARVLDKAGYAGRSFVWLFIDHAEDAELAVNHQFEVDPTRPGVETIEFSTEVSNDRLLADPMPVVRDAMDAVWQAFGIENCLLFDSDGSITD